MKLQHIVAAVAMVAAGAANASVDQFTTGNGSLFLIAFDNAGGTYTTTSMFVDLGYNLNDFKNGAALTGNNQKVVWNFGDNTVTVNGSLANLGTNAWTTAFDKLVANSDAGQIKWTIGAGDQTGSGANVNYLVTATANATLQNSSNTNSMSAVNGMFTGLQASAAVSLGSTVASADNGAFTYAAVDGVSATSANGYVVASTAFGTNWQTKDVMINSITTASKNNLWLLQGNGTNTRIASYTGDAAELTNGGNLLNNAGTFYFDIASKTLTWETAAVQAAVPEPSTYALALMGLVVAGAVARRRAA